MFDNFAIFRFKEVRKIAIAYISGLPNNFWDYILSSSVHVKLVNAKIAKIFKLLPLKRHKPRKLNAVSEDIFATIISFLSLNSKYLNKQLKYLLYAFYMLKYHMHETITRSIKPTNSEKCYKTTQNDFNCNISTMLQFFLSHLSMSVEN